MAEEGLAMVPPLPPKYRLKDAILGDHGDADRQDEHFLSFFIDYRSITTAFNSIGAYWYYYIQG